MEFLVKWPMSSACGDVVFPTSSQVCRKAPPPRKILICTRWLYEQALMELHVPLLLSQSSSSSSSPSPSSSALSFSAKRGQKTQFGPREAIHLRDDAITRFIASWSNLKNKILSSTRTIFSKTNVRACGSMITMGPWCPMPCAKSYQEKHIEVKSCIN